MGACAWAIASAASVYEHMQQRMVGLKELVGGAICFLLAAAISLAKTGIVQRWLARRRGDVPTRMTAP